MLLQSRTWRLCARRMEKAVLGGSLWHEQCREACTPAGSAALPESFAGAAAYVRAYEPLLFSEAQAGLLQSLGEAQHKAVPVAVERYASTCKSVLNFTQAAQPRPHAGLPPSPDERADTKLCLWPLKGACMWCPF